MKLIVQVPCLNEEKTLPLVLKSIPKKIAGINKIDILIIDDGSTDNTIKVAKSHGVKNIVRHASNMGLARSFSDGVNRALELGADIVVNTDGDNQYPQKDIAKLVQPIIKGRADIVIADRQTQNISEFSRFKKILQKIGSKIVNIAAGTDVPDAASGFRAYSREALLRLNVVTKFSYCMETIIQAGNKRLAIVSLPIITNPKTRESRLFKSTAEHVRKSAVAIIRAYIMYRPYMLFVSLGLIFLLAGLTPIIRFMFYYFNNQSGGHLQSLIGGVILVTCALFCFVLGVIADLIRINRTLIEKQLELAKKSYYS